MLATLCPRILKTSSRRWQGALTYSTPSLKNPENPGPDANATASSLPPPRPKTSLTPGATPQKLAESPRVFGVPQPPQINKEGWVSTIVHKAKDLINYDRAVQKHV